MSGKVREAGRAGTGVTGAGDSAALITGAVADVTIASEQAAASRAAKMRGVTKVSSASARSGWPDFISKSETKSHFVKG
jgi:hypothetical protein